MGIRIQPREIDVPEDDPFKNDLLGRKEPAEILTHLVGSIEGPCVLAIDAAWGAGKTTFLRIWSQHLRKQGFPVVEFNAWETDHSGDPFVALSGELTEGLQEYKDEPLAPKIAKTKEIATEILRQSIPNVIRATAADIGDVPLMEEVSQSLVSYAKDKLSGYQKAQKSVNKFRNVLQDMAGTLSKARGDRPLIVVIDELDRCRPSYAVELLEVAKHLFSVENIVFVLAVNRSELGHSINALYGSEFDAEGYLRRFFDVDFRLPEPERNAFIVAMLKATQINDYFSRTNDENLSRCGHADAVQGLLQGFFGSSDLSLRLIAQAIHRLGLVFASLRSDRWSLALVTVVALIVRTIDSDLYYRFVRGEVSDLEVVNTIFNRPSAKALKHEDIGGMFEAILIRSRAEITPSSSSELLQKYKDQVATEGSDNASQAPEQNHANKVTELVGVFRSSRLVNEFKDAAQRLELLSTDLVEERTGVASNDS